MNHIAQIRLVFLIGLLVGSATTAPAGQVNSTWVGGAAGDWDVPSNWSPAVVPDNDVTDTYLVTIGTGSVVSIPSGTYTVDGLTIAAGDTLQILAGATLNVGAGPWNNDGLVVVNPGDGLAVTVINFTADVALDGTGMLQLDGFAQRAQMTTDPGATVTNSLPHEIRGRGEVHAALDNHGTVIADNGELVLLTEAKRNNGLFTNNGVGSTITFDNVLIDQNPILQGRSVRMSGIGITRADSGSSFIYNTQFCGGFAETINGGVFNPVTLPGGMTAAFKSMHLSGQFDGSGAGGSPDAKFEGAPLDPVEHAEVFTMFFGTIGFQGSQFFKNGEIHAIGSGVDVVGNADMDGDGFLVFQDVSSFHSSTSSTVTTAAGIEILFPGGTHSFDVGGTFNGPAQVSGPGTSVILGTTTKHFNDTFAFAGGSSTTITAPVDGPATCTVMDAGTSFTVQSTSFTCSQFDVGMDATAECDNATATCDVMALNGNALIQNSSTVEVTDMQVGPDASVNLETNSWLTILRDFENRMTDEPRHVHDPDTVLELAGGMGIPIGQWKDWTRMEVAGMDFGLSTLGFIDNFHVEKLRLGPGSRAYLKDHFDNGNRIMSRDTSAGGVTAEALYVNTLEFADPDALLNVNGLNLYYNIIIGDPSQIIDVAVVLCPADLDGNSEVGIDDLLDLLAAWGTPAADLDGNGDTDILDLLELLAAWGPCA